jgi:hypothetical protein
LGHAKDQNRCFTFLNVNYGTKQEQPRMHTRTIFASSMIALLAACGGSDGVNIGAPPTRAPSEPAVPAPTEPKPTDQLFADTGVTPGAALAAGKTLVASESANAASKVNYGSGDVEKTTAVFKLKKNDAGALTFTVNGVDHVFKPGDKYIEDDGKSYGYEVENDVDSVYYNMWSWTGTLDEAADPARKGVQIWEYSSNQVIPDGGPNVQGFAIVGAETRSAALTSLPTAKYTGRVALNARPTKGFEDNRTSETRIRGDMKLTANFGAGTVSGAVDGIRVRPPGEEDSVDVAGTIAMNPSAIVGNGFAGGLAADAAYQSNVGTIDASSSYSGKFYRESAEQVAGVLNVTGQVAGGGGGYAADGFFEGVQD